MGKVRRYKKKLAKAAAGTNVEGMEKEEQQTDYLELAEELLSLRKDDDKMSVCSIMKSVKSSGGGESLKLKKDAKRYLKHAFLLKSLLFYWNIITLTTLGIIFIWPTYSFVLGLENTQKKLSKNRKKKRSNIVENDDDDDNDDQVNISKQKVLNWPVGSTNNNEIRSAPAKKHRKGYQKKQNAQL